MKYDPRDSTPCRKCCTNEGQPFLCGQCQWELAVKFLEKEA